MSGTIPSMESSAHDALKDNTVIVGTYFPLYPQPLTGPLTVPFTVLGASGDLAKKKVRVSI